MNFANYLLKEDISKVKRLFYENLSFTDPNYVEYYFNNEFKYDYHYVLKNEEGDVLAYVGRSVKTFNIKGKKLQASVLKNFIFKSSDNLHELLTYIEDHLNHQELFTLIEDNKNVFNLDIYSRSNVFEFGEISFKLPSITHLTEIIKPEELLEIYARFIKNFNGYEVRDIDYFKRKINENIATSSKYLLFKDGDKIYGYAHVRGSIVDEIVYLKKEVIDEILAYLFVNYDFISITTSNHEALNDIYKCQKREKIRYKYQINNPELLAKLYKIDIDSVPALFTGLIY